MKKYLIGTITILTLTLIGISYAYWVGVVEGEGANISITLDKVHILFTDSTEIADNKVRPGWSTTKNFTVENQGTTDFSYDIYIKNFISTLETENYLQYKITSTNGYNMTDFEPLPKSSEATNQDLATGINVLAGVTQEYTIEFRYVNDPDVDQSEDMGANFSGQLMIEATKETKLYDKLLLDHPTINTRTDFDNVFGSETPTTGVIYKESTYRETPESTGSENNNKDVYYFAGNVRDNWVSFGGYMWRIIRTNEDGSVRLLYHGFSTIDVEAYIGNSPYNSIDNNTIYSGYMYGTAGSIANNRKNTTSSKIKTTIDNWYKTNIFDKNYDGYVSKTAIYCNDRASGQYASSGVMNYAARERLQEIRNNGRIPSYQCGQNTMGGYTTINGQWQILSGPYTSSKADVADKFSANTGSGGNGKLQYGVALMTADEVSFAGGVRDKKAPYTYYYLNGLDNSSIGNRDMWTMTPYGMGSFDSAMIFNVQLSDVNAGMLDNRNAIGSLHIRPVLSLKSCIEWKSGDGTPESPYEVKISDTCNESVN